MARALERLFWTVGVALVGVGVLALAHRSLAATAARAVDTRLWAPERVKKYEAAARARTGSALAVLRIPRIGLDAPVLDGTDELTLNAGVGLIEDTARPGGGGNVGIAGHRDGFFRALKDAAVGDEVDLDTPAGTETYAIESIRVVDPEDVSVLGPTAGPALTLVSCYPFYWVGPAPKRVVVRAVPRAGPR